MHDMSAVGTYKCSNVGIGTSPEEIGDLSHQAKKTCLQQLHFLGYEKVAHTQLQPHIKLPGSVH